MVFSVRFLLVVATLVAGGQHATAVTLNIEHYGAVAGDKSLQTAKQNVKAINAAFADAANFSAGVKVEVPPGKEYWALGGILGGNLHDFTFMVNGVLKALPDLKNWPLTTGHKPSYLNFLQFVNSYQTIFPISVAEVHFSISTLTYVPIVAFSLGKTTL